MRTKTKLKRRYNGEPVDTNKRKVYQRLESLTANFKHTGWIGSIQK